MAFLLNNGRIPSRKMDRRYIYRENFSAIAAPRKTLIRVLITTRRAAVCHTAVSKSRLPVHSIFNPPRALDNYAAMNAPL